MANDKLPMLNKKLLKEKLLGTELADYSKDILDQPEKVIQFGEGNFLRAFVEWMFHQMNKENVFNGSVVVVQPISTGRVCNLNEQDGLYTLYLRGREQGKTVNKKEIITSISRGVNSYSQWDEVLKCAENPEIEFLISNTTEAGIAYHPEDKLEDTPPDSYPGKVTAYLYHRYQTFNGDSEKGMILIPCELIDRNGDNLKKIVIKLADDWGLPAGFVDWVKEHNVFLNTLVDRIVTGYPFNEVEELEKELGYHDQNLDTGEIFHLWIIEGDEGLKEKLPFHKVGLNVKWVEDMTPYRTRKVRILNGAHTSTVPVSFLANVDLVRDAVNDKLLNSFIRRTVFEEIIPTLNFDEDELKDFAEKIFDRFNNPFIDHKWLDISLNSTSKFKTRVLPSLKGYIEDTGEVPSNLSYSLAALIAFYKGTEIEDNNLVAYRGDKTYKIMDDLEALEFFKDVWTKQGKGEINLGVLVKEVLAHQDFWKEDLNQLPGLKDKVTGYLEEILDKGMQDSLQDLMQTR